MKNNKGITLVKLLLIILIMIALCSLISMFFLTDISQSIDIFYKNITHQINLSSEIKDNETLLGITDVKGEGLIIKILDGKDMIHQEDLIIMIDELKNAGSQAISINEQRITNSTYLYCDGSVILLDGEKIGNPFIIKAIGNKETLYGAITRNKGYVSILKKDKIEINIEKSDDIKICKTKNNRLINYANGKNRVEQLKRSNQLVGKSDIKGKGIEIVINENKSKLSALVFLQIINDLNCGGAKAISINGNRVVNATDIMDISNTYILLNSIPIEGPFIIKAIGEPEDLKTALYSENSQYNKIKSTGNEIGIYEHLNLNVEKYIQKRDKNKMDTAYLVN